VAADVEGIKLSQPIILDGYHAVIPVNPSEKDPKSLHCDIAVTSGRALSGIAVGPDGKPLPGAHAAGLGATPKFFDRSEGKLAGASFTVRGLSPKKSRTVLLIHPEKRLAKLATVRPDEPEPFTVRLEPLGTLTGRVVAADGKPLAGLKVNAHLSYKLENYKSRPAELRFNSEPWSKLINREATTDGDGKFRIEGLVPGMKYLLTVSQEMEFFGACTRDDLTVDAGKTTDLGELKDKPPVK
jgi:hypothetical protein